MKRIHVTKKQLIAGIVGAGLLATTGVGYAYWSSTGQGSGTASVGTSTAWAVAQTTLTGGPLTPGGPTETIGYTVTNNSTGNQQLGTVTIQVAGITGTSPAASATLWSDSAAFPSKPACTKDDFTVGAAVAGATLTQTINQNLAPGATYTGSVVVAMVNRTDTIPGDGLGNQDNCKSLTPPLFYAAS